jgi:[ribosomal protein S18]-alanine N-acetyltransferase
MTEDDLRETLEIEGTTIYSPWSRDMFLREIERQNPGLIVFRVENRLIGYFCFWKVMDEAHLMNVSLHFDFRGKGLGRFLMNYLGDTCEQMEISRILLEVAETNHVAIKLYKKCGFVKVGIRKRFYEQTGDDAILMEKLIQADSVP